MLLFLSLCAYLSVYGEVKLLDGGEVKSLDGSEVELLDGNC